MENIDTILTLKLMNTPLSAWGMAFICSLGILIGLRIVQKIAVSRLKALSNRFGLVWPTHAMHVLTKTRMAALLMIALWGGSLFLDLPDKSEKFIGLLLAAAVFIQCGIWISALYDSWYEAYRQKHITSNASAVTTLGAAKFLVRLFVGVCVLLLLLDNAGFNITTLVTGLGIGGIAVALAVQNILSDLFASLSIILDKPFVIGDFIIVGDTMGAVEHIGLKTTRIRSISGEQIILSNSDLLGSRVRNYGRMFERRVVMTLGVTYQTPMEKLRTIPDVIRIAIEDHGNTRFDRAHFKSHGAFSLDFEYVYYIKSADYIEYMDTQQAINFALHAHFEKEGIEFAYPTQTVFVEKSGSEKSAA